jgi:UDP-GlcNAc:undecaprenyl-phosphate/decaprenyl-phosphate GlcNAc-1-phosphate transferase
LLSVTVAAPILAFVVSLLVVRLVLRRQAITARFTAAPRADRWNTTPTPAIGGIGIFAGIAVGLGSALTVGSIASQRELTAILVGCALLFVSGLLDDAHAFHPVLKLVTQAVAAVIVLTNGISVEVVGNDWLAFALGMLWLVGMTNALNLLDNMDGLAGSLAVVAAGYFAIATATVNPNRDVFVLAAVLAMATLGFLPYNVRPGKPAAAFMGDSGSQVLGFALAALGLMASYKVAGTTIATLVFPLLILAVPILDTGLVTLLRLVDGRPITQGGRDHTSHRLVRRGLSERRAVALLVAVSAALGATSLAYSVLDNGRATTAGVLVTFALLLQFATLLSATSTVGETPDPAWARPWAMRLRRLGEVVVDGALVVASFYAAYLIVVQGEGTINQRHLFLVSLPVVLFARYVAFIPFGLYRAVWRYAGARDAVSVAAAVVISEVAAYVFLDLTRTFGDFPASIFVVDALLCTVLVGAVRFGERAFVSVLESLRDQGRRRRTLIVGAGRSGRSLLRELRETPGGHVVGFVDDDPRLAGRRLQGVRVLGTTADLEEVLARAQPHDVAVTIPGAPPDRLAAMAEACRAAGVELRFVRREISVAPPEAARVGVE